MNILKEIKKHEGFKSKVYKCTEGYDTIGYGFAIKDLEMDEDVAELILMKKIKKLLEIKKILFFWRITFLTVNLLRNFSVSFPLILYLINGEISNRLVVDLIAKYSNS